MASSTQTNRIRVALALLMALAMSSSRVSSAQETHPAFVGAGGDIERHLRTLQLVGAVPLRIWSIRGFSASELETMLSQEADTFGVRLRTRAKKTGALDWQVLSSRAGIIGNSGFPYGFNDGPMWAGRGVTAYGEGGVAGRLGPVSARLHPMLFITQNAAFDLPMAGSYSWNTPYASSIDLPQRFGSRRYGRIDPGESELRADLTYLSVGLSTSSQVWGPAVEHPIILGNNAGGFAHAFLQTSKPLSFRFATLHAKLVWGRLDASPYRPAGAEDRHFVTGAVGAMSFPALPGLEIGATRFFHSPWPADGLLGAPFLNVFQGILKVDLASSSNPNGDVPSDNQLASVFMRWAFPESGFEFYGEFGREDHNWNMRDFWQEMDHDAATLLGLQKAWKRPEGGATVFRAEHLNTRMGKLHPVRPQAPWYVHGVLRTGHTERGQLLGSAGGFGGGATSLALDKYDRKGRMTFRWDRLMRLEQLENNHLLPLPEGADVTHALGAERTRAAGGGELTLGLTGVVDLNRDFAGDRFNLGMRVEYRILK